MNIVIFVLLWCWGWVGGLFLLKETCFHFSRVPVDLRKYGLSKHVSLLSAVSPSNSWWGSLKSHWDRTSKSANMENLSLRNVSLSSCQHFYDTLIYESLKSNRSPWTNLVVLLCSHVSIWKVWMFFYIIIKCPLLCGMKSLTPLNAVLGLILCLLKAYISPIYILKV